MQIALHGGASAITMTSLDLVDFINSQRKEGESDLRHDHFMAKVPKVLGEEHAPKFREMTTVVVGNGATRQSPIYRLPKREACLMAMSYSYELQAKVFDRMTELEARAMQTLPDFSNPVAAARAWADAEEAKQIAMQQLAIAAPKAEFVDKYVQSNSGSKGFRQVCKLLDAKENEFRAFLKDTGVMYKLGGEWVAHACHIRAGRFETKAGIAEHENGAHAYNTTRFTPKGIEWISAEWRKHLV